MFVIVNYVLSRPAVLFFCKNVSKSNSSLCLVIVIFPFTCFIVCPNSVSLIMTPLYNSMTIVTFLIKFIRDTIDLIEDWIIYSRTGTDAVD